MLLIMLLIVSRLEYPPCAYRKSCFYSVVAILLCSLDLYENKTITLRLLAVFQASPCISGTSTECLGANTS